MLMQKIALKILWADIGKALAMVLGVAFSTLLMAQQAAIFVCLMSNSASHVHAAQDVDIWVTDKRSAYFDDPGTLPTGLLGTVRGVEGVAYAAPYIYGQVLLDSPEFVETGILIGLDSISLMGAPQKMVVGTIESIRTTDTFALDQRGYSELWPEEDIQLGRILEVNNRRLRLISVIDPPSPFFSVPQIYTSSQTARLLKGRQNPSFILVRARDGENLTTLAARISTVTGFSAYEKNDFIQRTVDYNMKNTGIPINFMITIILGFVVGVAVVAQTFYLFVTENIKNLGVLKAMGATGVQLTIMTLVQCILIAIIGFSIGIAGTAWFFDAVPDKVPSFKGFYLPWPIFKNVAIAIIAISLFAGLVSIQRALRYDPAQVLR